MVVHVTKITQVDKKVEWSCDCGAGEDGCVDIETARKGRNSHLQAVRKGQTK